MTNPVPAFPPADSPSPLLAHVPGASALDGTVAAEASGDADALQRPTAWHYGDPLGEQAKWENGRIGLVDQWDRRALEVAGPEASAWLNNLISQKVDAIGPGEYTEALILDGQGHVEHYLRVLAVEGPEGLRLILDTPATRAEELTDYLRRMIFWAQVEVNPLKAAPLSAVFPAGCLGTAPGPRAGGRASLREVLAEAKLAELPPVARAWSAEALDVMVDFWALRFLGAVPVLDLWSPREQFAATWDALTRPGSDTRGALPLGAMAYQALRIGGREPQIDTDLDARTIPHEVPLFLGSGAFSGATQKAVAEEGPAPAAAVHLNKGCYRGQETVSRVHNLGRSPRVLVQLQVDGSQERLPSVGAEVRAANRVVGRIGSVVYDATYGPIALALVKRAVIDRLATDPGAVPPLVADGIDVAVDSADIHRDTAAQPGRRAVAKLRGISPR
ncbi:CAF17-like 4Fe-4S cluster assembly/insertion protein YgfZ [Corynebacterium heidelbergense]|uniref:Folate-binding protein n=1 Tax=Corynebacterium heidelbergense TaxID=2055947 RepID=A0A364V897_9CORY|nr:folate-binding protein YgfZ [Corynebacterium heidelbergense]RAV32786.1 folate-binding protein [Corynebacterium heidelbergense]